ncbi:hypothetical protein KCP77_01830 [Salmonella enterica subsp. enterica]|nr:hypothetical protein KCP77_01830 [Salmonella enterica subsp. enterica]
MGFATATGTSKTLNGPLTDKILRSLRPYGSPFVMRGRPDDIIAEMHRLYGYHIRTSAWSHDEDPAFSTTKNQSCH